MKPRAGSFIARVQPILASVVILLLVLQPLAPAMPLAASSSAAAQVDQPQALTYNSLSLAGVDGYVSVPHSPELNNLSAITIEAWVYRNSTSRNETVIGNGWTTSYWMGFSPTGKLRFIAHGGDSVDSTSTVVSGKWTHVAVTYNGSTRNFYINGALDRTTTVSPGSIVPNPTDPLGIGYDIDPFTGNYFYGMIDEVRIWNVVRTPAQIQASMFQTINTPLPSSLIGYWRLDGVATDQTGDHNGTLHSGLGDAWVNDGGLPKDIRIPQVSATPTLDGFCNPTEYANALNVSVDGILVTLQHTATALWVCYDFSTASAYTRASLLIDPTHDRLDPAQPDDISLNVYRDGSLLAYVGNDAGQWVITDTYNTLWSGGYGVSGGEFPTYSAEFRVDSSVVGGWGHVIGLALKPYVGIGLTGIWPALAVSNLPSTWSSATLAGTGPARTFSGTVQYQPKNHTYVPTSVAGAVVELYGYDTGGSDVVVASTTTNYNGSFSINTNDDFTHHRLELVSFPQGYNPTQADAPAAGTVLDVRTIDYGTAGGGTYSGNIYTLGDTIPENIAAPYGPVFLVVAPQAVIDGGALEEFQDFKIQQGFAVSIRSVEYVDANYSGPTRLERIRAMEKDYLANNGNRFQFVMLVGTNAVIPFAKITPYATGANPICPTETPMNYKYSNWPYVDLTSDPNTNGNGCYLDGTLTDPAKLIPGYIPDSFAYDPTVSLGRIPFDQPNTVRQALHNSIGFESQSESYKLKALDGMSMVGLKGYYNGQACTGDNWGNHCVAPIPNDQSNYDTSLLSYQEELNYLFANGFVTTPLYENEATVAGGQLTSPVDLTLDHIRSTLDGSRFGLATMSGHGNSSGVYRNFWSSDKNTNGRVDVTSDPATTELTEVTFFDISGVLDQIDPQGSRGSVFVLIACSNGDPNNTSNLAATILADGHGPASVAALSMVTVGSWFTPASGNDESIGYYVSKRLVSDSYRLGESVWWTLADLVRQKLSGSGGVAYDLYGDPTLSFFGNPDAQTTLAAWPMGRRDPTGDSYLALPGPTYPKKLWEYTTGMHTADTYGPTPLVSNNGEVIVAAQTYVDVLRQGALYQRLNLDGYVFGSPALSADGTVYVMDQDANLYAFPYMRLTINGITILLNDRSRRWKVNLGENPQASPVVGSDGFILAGVGGPSASEARLWLVRPDGQAYTSFPLDMNPTYYATTDASRTVYVATYGEQGHLYRFAPFCDMTVFPDVCPYDAQVEKSISAPFGTPPLLAGGSLYVGDVVNKLYKFNKDTLAIEATYTANGPIQIGPILSPIGDIVFVTSQGMMYSITEDLGILRWQKNLGSTSLFGIPAASNNAIYLAFGGYLRAYNPSSGALLWKRSLGGEISYASVSVGYGREVYVQGVTGKVLAFGEGWSMQPARIRATAGLNVTRSIVTLEILQSLPPISGTLSLAPSPLPGGNGDGELAPAATIIGVLLQRSADGGPWVDLAILAPGTTSYVDTSVQPNVSYAYRIQNLMSDGTNSDFETTLDVVQSYPGIPAAPTLDPVQVTGAETLGLSWTPDANSIVDNYVLERSLSGGGPFTTVITVTGETTSLQDTGLAPATPYFYRVRAVNSNGSSAASNVQSGTTRSQTLGAPQNFQAVLNGKTDINLTWNAGPAGATAVIEMITFGSTEYIPLDSVAADAGAYSLSIGEPGAYNFRIKFVQGEDESVYAYSIASLVILETLRVYLPVTTR